MTDVSAVEDVQTAPKWRPLNRYQRRVVGVLVEKAKTTPDAYPLSLNGLTTGCNQKSNRDPQMNLDPDQVEEALDQLREMGAVGEVHGGGRVVKYRHYMKDWLEVSGTELAVMAELLLRGPQTIGELRGRAARMAAGDLPDLSSLRPVVQSLVERNLVFELTPEGRGQVVTHGLYLEGELDKVRRRAESMEAGAATPTVRSEPPASAGPATAHQLDNQTNGQVQQLRQEVGELRAEVERLKKEIEDVWSNLQ